MGVLDLVLIMKWKHTLNLEYPVLIILMLTNIMLTEQDTMNGICYQTNFIWALSRAPLRLDKPSH